MVLELVEGINWGSRNPKIPPSEAKDRLALVTAAKVTPCLSLCVNLEPWALGLEPWAVCGPLSSLYALFEALCEPNP